MLVTETPFYDRTDS